jgi:signal transduction histidine kinase
MAGYGARAGDPPSLPAGAGVGGTIFETGQPLYVGDVRNDPRVLGPFLRDEGIASMLGVPLRSRGRLVGVLHVDWRQPHAGSASDLHLLETAAERCAAAIVNARLFAELRSTNEQLRALSARVQTVREEEAVRIAREIHDELGQLLTGLSLDIGWIRTRVARIASSETEPILARAEAVAELTDRTIRTVQRISEELRPAALDQLGLEAAIGVQLEGLAERSGIATSLGGTLGDRRLGDAIETGVFRIVQELLTNVARHSGATAVRVDLGLDGERGETLVVRVSDNGRGISPSDLASARSIGLVGLRERAILLGGTVDLGGEPGRGTEAVVRVPSGTRAP